MSDLVILSADLSLRRPGFALLSFRESDSSLCLLAKSSVDDKKGKKEIGDQ